MLKSKRKTLGQFGTDVSRNISMRKIICNVIRSRMPEQYADKTDDFISKYSSVYMEVMIMICNMGYEIYEAIEEAKEKINY